MDPSGIRGEGITIPVPIEATSRKYLRKNLGGTIKTLTNYNNGTQKMQFIIYFKPAYKQEWTLEYIYPVPKAKDEKKKYITI